MLAAIGEIIRSPERQLIWFLCLLPDRQQTAQEQTL